MRHDSDHSAVRRGIVVVRRAGSAVVARRRDDSRSLGSVRNDRLQRRVRAPFRLAARGGAQRQIDDVRAYLRGHGLLYTEPHGLAVELVHAAFRRARRERRLDGIYLDVILQSRFFDEHRDYARHRSAVLVLRLVRKVGDHARIPLGGIVGVVAEHGIVLAAQQHVAEHVVAEVQPCIHYGDDHGFGIVGFQHGKYEPGDVVAYGGQTKFAAAEIPQLIRVYAAVNARGGRFRTARFRGIRRAAERRRHTHAQRARAYQRDDYKDPKFPRCCHLVSPLCPPGSLTPPRYAP